MVSRFFNTGRIALFVVDQILFLRRIANGSSVFLDAGSTAQPVAVAVALRNHQGLRVVNCNLLAALSLQCVPNVTVQVTGGELRGEESELVGYQAVTMLQDVRVDVPTLTLVCFLLYPAPKLTGSFRPLCLRRSARDGQDTQPAAGFPRRAKGGGPADPCRW